MSIRANPAAGKIAAPFATAWEDYLEEDWRDVLPVSRRNKKVLVTGYSGWAGATPSLSVLRKWATRYKAANIAVRMPADVAGIDVDAYHGGDATLQELEWKLGPLPVTWRSTSRAPEDPVSGIYLFGLPAGALLAGTAGQGIEIIQRHHRYAIVPHSIHPETGRRYSWWAGGTDVRGIPHPDALPMLPGDWLEFLTSSRVPGPPAGELATLSEARDWYRQRASGEPCEFMDSGAERALSQVREAAQYGGLHDTLSVVTLRLCRWASEGHPGLHPALSALRAVFLSAGRPRGRDLTSEWRRAVGGAAAQVAPHDTGDDDPCEELRGLSPFGEPR